MSLVRRTPPKTPMLKGWAGRTPALRSKSRVVRMHYQDPRSGRLRYSFLNSLSNALRASSAFRGAGGPALTAGDGTAADDPFVPSRATVTLGVKSEHSL